MWITPLLFPLIFIIVWASNMVPIISQMDGQSLAMWQAITSYVVSIVAFFLVLFAQSRPIRKRELQQVEQVEQQPQHNHQQHNQQAEQQVHAMHSQLEQSHHHISHLQNQLSESQKYQQMASEYMQHNAAYADRVKELEDELRLTKQRLSISRESVSVTLREIEAKAKAINFVVGRVYADKKGGSKDIREQLHIPRELYNEFSQITTDYTSSDAARLLNILMILQNKLALYELPENKIFTLDSDAQIPLERDGRGNDPIIEVLSKNDQDPVVDYYTGAKEVCAKLVEFLESQD